MNTPKTLSGPALALTIGTVVAGPNTADYTAVPPFLALNAPRPNVLIVLDNSNSMDEDVAGTAVGSDHPGSRSEIARHAVGDMIDSYNTRMRFGLMAYRQSDIASRHIHNAFYYLSWDPATLDATDPDWFTPRDQATNTRSYEFQPGRTLYYDQALPYYSGSNEGTATCYSTGFQPRPDPTPPVTDINVNIAQDNPYRCCSGKSGTADISPDGVDNDATAAGQYSGCFGNYNFGLTDSDVAAGFWQIGAQIAWNHVGTACLSTAAPGGGLLHVPVDDSSSGHLSDLAARLGTWSGDCSSDTPLRNAGFTPLASTLQSARDYFEGDLAPANGGPRDSPLQYGCQRNFVVLVTDGLPTEDLDGDGDFIDDTVDEAAALRNIQVDLGGATVNCDVQTFVLGFALPEGIEGALDPVAVAGGTDVNGAAYYAGSETELITALNALFLEILNRGSSGTATAINLSSFRGEGMAVRATFQPRLTDGTHEVTWTGQLNALFVDDAGNLREDNGDATLGLTVEDPFVDMCYQETNRVVRVKKSTDEADRPDADQLAACDAGVFPSGLEEVSYLWDAGLWLAGLDDADLTAQRAYASSSGARYILTALDGNGDGQVNGAEQTDFVAGSFSATNAGLLDAADAAEAGAIVNWIRGVDGGYRSRKITLDGVLFTWRLGDIVYSSPVVVGRPAEGFDLLYRDSGYGDFFEHYHERRQVVYVGANDGLLHAFNGGWYDPAHARFLPGATGATQFPLGAELWAYAPYNLLPHLKYLTRPDYGSGDGDHVFYVDLQPRVFDARIFGNDGIDGQPGTDTHPGGWGTVLVVGMRFGGGQATVDVDPASPGSDLRTLRSAYLLFDVTDPEQPPRLLTEFTHPELGYTTSIPTPLTLCRDAGGFSPPGCTLDDWYLLLGSGPHPADATALATGSSDQNARLFLLNLKTMALESAFGNNGVAVLGSANSLVSDLVAVDYNLDFSTDAAYFGTVSGSVGAWGGGLWRLRTVHSEASVPWTYYGVPNWAPSLVHAAGRPITAMPAITLDRYDNRWLFVGSGRFLVQPDATDLAVQRYHGIKEPRDTGGDFTWGTTANLLDVTNAVLYETSEELTGVNATVTNGSPCPPGDVETFNELECFLRQFSHADDYRGGWYHDFTGTGERNVSRAALLSGALSYTSYLPSNVMCEAEGESRLNVRYFATGTAYPEAIIGLDNLQHNGHYALKTGVDMGVGLALSPSLHSGSGYASQGGPGRNIKAFVQTSTGTTLIQQETVPFTVRPGEMSWREHMD